MPSSFYNKVYATCKRIPKGKVATYGQIAALCGSPKAAMQVGWALHALDSDTAMGGVPWQRIINREGRISTTCTTHPPQQQAALLVAEGVDVKKKNDVYLVNLKQFLWNAGG